MASGHVARTSGPNVRWFNATCASGAMIDLPSYPCHHFFMPYRPVAELTCMAHKKHESFPYEAYWYPYIFGVLQTNAYAYIHVNEFAAPR